MKYRIPWYLWAIVAFVIALAISLIVGQYTGIYDVYFSFFFMLFIMMIIVIIASVGGFFLGMIMSHRILSKGEFTPFEEEMLKMRQEVTHLKGHVEKIVEHHGLKESTSGETSTPSESRLRALEERLKAREHELAEKIREFEEKLKEKVHHEKTGHDAGKQGEKERDR
jgi:hypothetical protein